MPVSCGSEYERPSNSRCLSVACLPACPCCARPQRAVPVSRSRRCPSCHSHMEALSGDVTRDCCGTPSRRIATRRHLNGSKGRGGEHFLSSMGRSLARSFSVHNISAYLCEAVWLTIFSPTRYSSCSSIFTPQTRSFTACTRSCECLASFTLPTHYYITSSDPCIHSSSRSFSSSTALPTTHK